MWSSWISGTIYLFKHHMITLLSLLSTTWFTLSGFILPLSLDHDLVYPDPVVQEEVIEEPVVETPLFEWIASWYDYKLSGKWWSKTHDTCALRIKQRYWRYKVCSDRTWKCVECYHNDYWPSRSDRVIDLSSHAFRELWEPLSRWLTHVKVYRVE